MPSDKENEGENIMANGTNLGSPPVNSGHTSRSVRSPLERKELLRSFLQKTQALTDCTKQTMLTLDEIGKEIDLINLEVSIDEKACCQDEVLMDSQIMTASSNVLQKASTMLTKELCPYDFREFADKLKKYVFKLPDTTLDAPCWPLFAPEVVNCFKRTPNFSALSGCLIPLEKKVVVKRQPGKRDPLAPTSRPEAIINVEKEDDSVEETVQRIKLLISNHLKKTGKPIEYFRLILDPVEFGKTVENLLHVAFLIRDGMIKLQDDEAGEPVVVPCSKEMRAAAKRDKIPNIQNVVSLDFNSWQALVKLHRIERAMIDFT